MPEGLITKSTGSWYTVRDENGKEYPGRLRGKFKIKGLKVTNPIAVGDRVIFEQEAANPGHVWITDLLPRQNYIIRQSIKRASNGHMIAANIDQAALVATLFYPRTSLGFIDRFTVSAEAFRIPVLLIFNKADLLGEETRPLVEEFMGIYQDLGYRCLLVSAESGYQLEALKAALRQQVTLISGHSGVGKSTLINQIAPGLELPTAAVSDFAEKGVHTTTFAEMFEWETGSFLIDTPGIKELGLFDMQEREVADYFPEFRQFLGQCKFHNCRHIEEPGCAVKEALEAGQIAPERYDSYLSMVLGQENHR